jgi:hypothetical protein
MEHFVTLFDSLFLPQGVALHTSMQRHVKNYTLWILCVDDEVHRVLLQLNLSNVRLLQLSQLETNDLLRVKHERNKGEYCWTLTPFAPRFVFEADASVSRVTYIDADIWFRKDPTPIFEEFDASGKAILITDHAYASENDQSATSGQYCVQFMTFHRVDGEDVRKWWETRCIEWCFDRNEDDKFGDQKYLDAWPIIFKDKVHILGNKELCLAPWNVSRFPYGNSIIYHFQGLRIKGKNSIDIGGYLIPKVTYRAIYENYFSDLIFVKSMLIKAGVEVMPQTKKRLFNYDLFRLIIVYFRKYNYRRIVKW